MTVMRHLSWEGCDNVRDLGGLRTLDGRITRRGVLVRSDDPSKLTAAGWAELHAHGIRTIISLETAGLSEEAQDVAPRPADLTTMRVAIEDITDTEFVEKWVKSDLWCTPLYFRDALIRWPERHAAAIAAVAKAKTGGVLVHCHRGNDRTGIIAMLLLALVGVAPDDIATDYAMSPDPRREELLRAEHRSTREVILDTLAWLDVEDYLRTGGLSKPELESVRKRLLEPIGDDA